MPADALNQTTKPEVRFGFVELLFALAAGEIATEVTKVVLQARTASAWAAYSHLVLALFLVASSWVGWTHSSAPGNRTDVLEVFSWPFVVLVLDVLLVVAYFFLASSASLHLSKQPSDLNPRNAAGSVCLIFVGYLLWDVMTRVVMATPGQRRSIFWPRVWISGACTVLSFLAWAWVRDVRGSVATCFCNMALLTLVALFRAGKQGYRVAAFVMMAAFSLLLLVAKYATVATR